MVHLLADVVAGLVIFRSPLADACFLVGATIFQQVKLLVVICQEDVQIAFDLFGGRPINLAILLGALHVFDVRIVRRPAVLDARLELNVADGIRAPVLATLGRLKMPLDLVTFQIN